jgi:hypothetical protein
MPYDIAADIRLDPRIKALLAQIGTEPSSDVDSRETLLAEANSEAARQGAELFRAFMDLCIPRRLSRAQTATRSTSR